MLGWNESAWFAMLVGAALKGTFVLGTAWLLVLVMRRRSAAARHLVWTGAAAALLALPVLSVALPALQVRPGVLAPLVSTITFRTTAWATAGAPALASAQLSHSMRPPTGAPWRFDYPLSLTLLWAAGSALALAHMLAAWAVMWRIRRGTPSFPDSQLFHSLKQALGIRRNVDLLQTPRGTMPMSFGVRRPAVFLPADAHEWSQDRRRVVMLHELAHVRRGDLATHLLVRTAVSLFWWNPLAWMAWREFVKERERAADDLVLSAGEPAPEYAGHLLEIARSMQEAPSVAWAALAMARPSQLEGRLLAILDSRIDRKSPGPRAALAAAVLAVALVAPFAALQAQEKVDPVIAPTVEATIRAAIEQQNHEILDAAAAAYVTAQKYEAARQLLENSLTLRAETSGDHSSAYAMGLMKLGDLAARRNQDGEAVAFYTKAVALGDTPETASALIYLAGHALESKDTVQAESLVDRALHASPTGRLAGRALTLKGNIALANGLPGLAELQYLQALAQAPPGTPEAASTMEMYARLLTDQSRTAEAQAMKDRARPIRAALVASVSSQWNGAGVAFKVGGGVSAPTLLFKKDPEYSEDARAAKYQGTVMLSIVIGTDGKAYDIKLVKSLGLGLDEKAVEAVNQWKFNPGKRGDTPVSVEATIEVNFRLL